MTTKALIIVLVSAAALWGGCADLKNSPPDPVTPGVQVHDAGWTSPSAANFHGNTIRNANWDMTSCKTCHGPSYTGGTSGVSCNKCHTDPGGVENCATCHGSVNPAPPRDLSGNTSRGGRGVGAHQIHFLGSSIGSAIMCQECHTVPGAIYAAGHIDNTPNAEVVMNNPLARTVTNEPTTVNHSSTLPLFTPNPAYDPASLTCASTYCHGNFKNGNPDFKPVWTDATGSQMACGTCHGDVSRPTLIERALPKTAAQGGTHPSIPTGWTCANCHGDVVDASTRIINPLKHINGKLNLGPNEIDF